MDLVMQNGQHFCLASLGSPGAKSRADVDDRAISIHGHSVREGSPYLSWTVFNLL